MTIQILGPGCKRCQALASITQEAVVQLGLDARVAKITDYGEMARLGVMSTPALAIDGRVAFSGSVPSVEHVKGLLADAVR